MFKALHFAKFKVCHSYLQSYCTLFLMEVKVDIDNVGLTTGKKNYLQWATKDGSGVA